MIRKTAVIFLFHSQEKMTNDLTRKKKKIRGERDGIFCSLFEPVATVDSLPFFFSFSSIFFFIHFSFLVGTGRVDRRRRRMVLVVSLFDSI